MFNKNNPKILHETIIRDIVDVVMDAKDSDTLKGIFAKDSNSFKSITKASSNMILVFPVPASTSIKIENSSMVCKAIERKAVALLQILFSTICITDAKSAEDLVSRFHKNLNFDTGLSVDQFMDTMDKYVIDHENAGVTITDREKYELVKEDLKNLSYYLDPVKETTPISEYKIHNTKHGVIITEGYGRRLSDDRIANALAGTQAVKNASDVLKNRAEVHNKQVIPSDIKKANELMPTLMTVNFVAQSDSGTPFNASCIVGVKAKLYPVDSADIVTRLALKNKDNNGFNKFIRATTREISFWRDLVFAVDKAKVDALSTSNRGSSSRMWKLLERRALKSRIRRTLGQTNDALAITSLVVSQEEVELLKKEENIDLSRVQTVRPIMDAYNLMAFVIVNEATECVKFLFDDGESEYETLSFSHLERESADGSYKKVINLMTKISR